jgi:DNA-binding transcriptional ArsR family regulator
MNEIELIFDKLYSYFNVATITELAQKLDMSQPAVTNWLRRNSISAIKKRCRELGIYNEIFGDLNSNTTINQGNNSRAAGKNYIESGHSNEKEINFDNITIGLIKKAIEKFGSEEKFQIQFMNFLIDKGNE